QDDCGEWVTALCPYGEYGCLDDEGKYDIVIPKPTDPTLGFGYRVRVMDAVDESIADCSSEFIVVASNEDSLVGDDDMGDPHLEVFAAADGDVAFAGGEYTVEFDYDNGVGSKADWFSIGLYMADGGSGDCGTYVTSICDEESIGCKDSSQ
ncbi:unnamed protein product, partial [Laminaria digitata]